jgi:hypothetical protein
LAFVEKLQASGLTKSEFCRRNRISSGRFYDLAKRYGDGSIPSTHGARRTRKPRTEAPEFLKVDVALYWSSLNRTSGEPIFLTA